MVASTIMGPRQPVIFGVVHHFQDVDDAPSIVHTANQTEPVVAHVEHDAVPDLIRRTEGLPKVPEVVPIGILGHLVPGGEIAFGDHGFRFGPPRLPEPT